MSFKNTTTTITRRHFFPLYVHLLKEPETTSVFLHPLTELPRRATLLNTGEAIQFDADYLPRLHNQNPERCLRLKHLPVNERPTDGWVLKLEFEKFPGSTKPTAIREETK